MTKPSKDSKSEASYVANSFEERQQAFLQAQYQEVGINFRAVWDFYIKFYIAFIALNFTALGLVIQYMDQPHRWPVVLCFCIQNLLAAGTAWGVGAYSQQAADQQQAILGTCLKNSQLQSDPAPAFQSPIPAKLAIWSGHANALSQFLFMVCWIMALFIKEVKTHV
jgi:hypothetical protein